MIYYVLRPVRRSGEGVTCGLITLTVEAAAWPQQGLEEERRSDLHETHELAVDVANNVPPAEAVCVRAGPRRSARTGPDTYGYANAPENGDAPAEGADALGRRAQSHIRGGDVGFSRRPEPVIARADDPRASASGFGPGHSVWEGGRCTAHASAAGRCGRWDRCRRTAACRSGVDPLDAANRSPIVRKLLSFDFELGHSGLGGGRTSCSAPASRALRRCGHCSPPDP